MRSKVAAILLAVSAWTPSMRAQNASAQPAEVAEAPLFRSASNEIVLDMAVTDKKGRPILDLKKEEVSVIDSGAKQEIVGFRLVDTTGAGEGVARSRSPQLATLVFENAGSGERQQTRQAALEFLKAAPTENYYISVIGINQQICLLQPFTTNREELKAAIDLATNSQPQAWITHSKKLKATLAASSKDKSGVEKRLADVMLGMTKSEEVVTEGARATVFGLLSLVRGQTSFPGRKAIVYISWGMWIPPHLDEPFRNLQSAANRGNVSFYPISVLGVATWSQNSGAAAQLRAAAAISAEAITSSDGRVGAASMVGGDIAETASRNNIQSKMMELAESTGGQFVGDTNNYAKPMKQAVQELTSYYEVTYSPNIQNYDGSFRKTEIKVTRDDAKVRARSGYYALPVTATGETLMSYEMPLVKALQTQPLAKDVAFQSAAVRFQSTPEGNHTSLLLEVPMSSITFTQDTAQAKYRSRLSAVALIKNAEGQVVQKFSHDLPLIGPLDKMAMAKAGRFLWKEKATLPPGRYLLETAVLDQGANKLGAKRAALVIPPAPAGVKMSNMVLVRRFEPAAKDLDPTEPFQFQGGRITPALSNTVFAVPGSTLSLFFVVYPDASNPAKPEAKIEYIKDGTVVGSGAVELPVADAQGRIPYVMSSPAEKMPPGMYEIRAVVKQGNTAIDERAFVEVQPAPQK